MVLKIAPDPVDGQREEGCQDSEAFRVGLFSQKLKICTYSNTCLVICGNLWCQALPAPILTNRGQGREGGLEYLTLYSQITTNYEVPILLIWTGQCFVDVAWLTKAFVQDGKD